MTSINDPLLNYYRLPAELAASVTVAEPRGEPGFFRFGENLLCYGRCSAAAQPVFQPPTVLDDALPLVKRDKGALELPFALDEVAGNLRQEKYVNSCAHYQGRLTSKAGVRAAYYMVRKFLPVAVRKHLQRIRLKSSRTAPFPAWPVDTTVDRLMERLLLLSLQARGVAEIPFIWFWPEGHQSCVLMTHDVETLAGRNFCQALMDLDRAHGIFSSFQVIPESRYPVTDTFLASIRDGGCEINIHDLNHDGHLYRDHAEFKRRVARINLYGKAFGAAGFRSGALYRNLEWYGELDFDYDMSVPNAGHLESQPGGCCTVLPYFIGEMLEIPVTMTQDYSLFHILKQYSADLWKSQIDALMRAHGLIAFCTHPDYLIERRARNCYTELLAHLSGLRAQAAAWITLPKEVNRWWRQRAQMTLARGRGGWEIQGEGAERARIAYAALDGERIVYRVETTAQAKPLVA